MATSHARITPTVSRKLGYYVYLYINPLDGSVFYVGKGRGNRALAHLNAPSDKAIAQTIRKVRKAGEEPKIEILAHQLTSEAALRVESAAIDLLGLTELDNLVRGHGTQFGRMRLEDAVAHYSRKPVQIQEPAILTRINRLYRFGMSAQELYDATRSAWKLGERRNDAQYAFAVYDSVVREVYRIGGWHEGGTTFNSRYAGRDGERDDRWEFVGVIADDQIRNRYLNRFVGDLFPAGAQNPICYVNI